MEFLGSVLNGKPDFGGINNARLAQWCAANEGARLRISHDARSAGELVRFIEGAIIPYFFYQSGDAFSDFGEAREAMKLEFNAVYVKDLRGDMQAVGGSMADLYKSKKRTQEFVDRVQSYFLRNGYEFPDSKDYVRWLSSAPLPDQIYPPLAALVAEHKKSRP